MFSRATFGLPGATVDPNGKVTLTVDQASRIFHAAKAEAKMNPNAEALDVPEVAKPLIAAVRDYGTAEGSHPEGSPEAKAAMKTIIGLWMSILKCGVACGDTDTFFKVIEYAGTEINVEIADMIQFLRGRARHEMGVGPSISGDFRSEEEISKDTISREGWQSEVSVYDDFLIYREACTVLSKTAQPISNAMKMYQETGDFKHWKNGLNAFETANRGGIDSAIMSYVINRSGKFSDFVLTRRKAIDSDIARMKNSSSHIDFVLEDGTILPGEKALEHSRLELQNVLKIVKWLQDIGI